MKFYGIKWFIILMMLWVILSGHFSMFFVMSGICSAMLSVVIVLVLLKDHYDNDEYVIYAPSKCSIVLLIRLLYYIMWIIKQVAISNLYIVRKVWRLKLDINDYVFQLIAVQQKNNLGAFILSNSITLTPGTVSIDVIWDDGYKIRVLAIDKELILGIDDIDCRVKELLQ
ncbi:Na+/H+ antiporter subunit E [Neoehrlichia mikurensis]|uniref:Na+/H+ antiporter subunit E n=1 Tax=Neoehrlichia mikurensis TaxID=89586 RepID=A0A9Q9BTU8_9RICK|nr:Na+/H+ antiporter subunit E [Neoehrlichia mikurensis]QXK92159.1 Na+/H+ antiporter subunit E [Neoehrlichia mikurensis]QXK92615.1 Na+/H+ antiporter subunit E [Neoehrlichia mikurensis]QXK93853.1 Na+/H+ antiporter subunit E [Neoehrlichia mikurensis]UTO55151.1 Na+/H+ antiporter subunit E [Neoehrlichia mikurensis]UTO56071.1 Na+/H+ antiporter subunit E [Neoehrlichia mikurensis]